MAKKEKLETWHTAVERVTATAAAFKAAVKVYDLGGPTSESSFASVKAAREVFLKAVDLEKKSFGKLGEPDEQGELPGTPAAVVPLEAAASA